uniref:NADH dehydrogenase subunit 6 n=1 Tax=Allonychiurus kimi TaxID=2779777 RepID=A0A7M3UYU5_9HEXA|nr:NADH dehydrogenase subunit 6 [Allonychiurus kimi]QOL12122.1 NADH dehydrogenase subunit 6 [Allonychiurus kimi]
MKTLIILMSIMLSLSFFFINHPIALVLIILLQTINLCMVIFMFTFFSWFSLILFLIFMGGLMVLFIYISSLASNEKFIINFKLLMIILLISTPLLFFLKQMNFQSLFLEHMNFKSSIYLVYSNFLMKPTLMVMMYLLITLIFSVNIIKLYEAPIRSLI